PTGDAEQAPSPEPEYEGIPEEILQRRREALKSVRQFGDPILRSEARAISDFGPDLLADAERMVSLMHDAMGIGLAAPQVGSSRRLLVYQVGDQRPVALANPVIEWASDLLEPADEGCLSLPSVEVEVERSVFVRVRAQDVFGDEIKVEASGVEARVIQHEMDHLDGVLIIDRASRDQRKAALKALREAEADSGFAA
ncbi:MAG: peptide deformylase, partial [Thermoleophilaceae bacterium]|nr:peptide deformylase [Thermoleophilaceae bacterium]